MNLLNFVSLKLKVDPALVYFYAHHYCEKRLNKKQIARNYLECKETGKVETFVSDWCLDYIIGSIKAPKGGAK